MGFTWSRPILIDSVTTILASDFNELKTNLDTIYTALGKTYPGCSSGAGWSSAWPVQGGQLILSSHAQEIRDRADWIYDNFCSTHYNGHNATHRSTHDATYYSSNNGTHYNTHNATYQSSYYNIDLGYDNTSHQTAFYIDDYSAEKGTHNNIYDTTFNSGLFSVHNYNHYISHASTVHSSYGS